MLKAALLLLIALAALATVAGEAAADGEPCRFTGTVQMDGADVPDGAVVTAVIGGAEYTTTTPTGYGPSTYSVEIQPPDGVRYDDGAQVTFTIDGSPADQTGSFRAGDNIRWDLTGTRIWVPQPEQPPPAADPSSTSTLLIALLALTCVAQVSVVGGVAYITIADWNP